MTFLRQLKESFPGLRLERILTLLLDQRLGEYVSWLFENLLPMRVVTRELGKSRSRAVRYLPAAYLDLGNVVHESRHGTWDNACLDNGTSRSSYELYDRQIGYCAPENRGARQLGSRWSRQEYTKP